MKLKPLYAISLAAIYGFAFTPTNFAADESDNSRALEVIIVTATKRAESLMDIPVSVSAISGAKIADQGIQDLDDASAYIPGFSVQPNPIADNINIRGVQSGNQAGFEQSVSTFVDGVYRGRGMQSRFSFLDVGLLEVLRGPQGTLFGKNTIGGALNISSAKPTSDLSAAISAKYNMDFEETEISGHLSGPLSDKLLGRVAFVSRAMDKGWVENQFYSENNPVTDEMAFRGILEYDMNDSTSFTLKAENGNFDNTGAPWDLITVGSLAAFGIEGNTDGVTSMGNGPAFMESIFGPGSAGNTDPVDFGSVAKLEGDVSEYALTMNHDTANGGEITAIAAYSEYDFDRFLDADFNPLPIIRFDDTEDFEQSSFELRYASPQDNKASYIAGVYYQDNSLYADGLSSFNLRAVNSLTTGGCLLGGGVIGTDLATTLGGNLVGGSNTALTRTCINAFLSSVFTGNGIEGFNRYASLDQDDTVKAVFGELSYDFTDTVNAKFGVRYTQEDKTAQQGVHAALYEDRGRTRISASSPLAPLYALGLDLVGEATEHSFDLARDEGSFTWSTNLSWDYSNDAMFYASASTGFKAGGFNSFAFRDDPAEAEFEEEEALSFELGGKFTLADGAAELNVAIFNSTFENLQTSLFAGSTSFVVQNAAEATSQGLEVDGRWQATDNLMVVGSAAYTDFTFDSFPNAGCTVDQLIDLREAVWNSGAPDAFTGALITLQNCGDLGLNDLTGRTSDNTPEFSANLGLNHTATINSFELISNLDLNYQGEQYRAADLDPYALDDATLRVNASLTFGQIDGNWDVSLIGNNLTDKNNINYLNDSPLFDESRQVAIMPPRSFSLRFRYKY